MVKTVNHRGSKERVGLSALCETYALGREELARVRALGAHFYEVFQQRLFHYGIALGIGAPSVAIQSVDTVIGDFEHGLGVPIRIERTIGALIIDSAAKTAILRRIFGDSENWSAENRLTSFEIHTLNRSLGKAIEAAIIASFGDLLSQQMTIMSVFVSEREAPNLMISDERMLTVRSAIETGGPAGSIILLMPLSPLIQARARLRQGYLAEVDEQLKAPSQSLGLGGITLEIRAVLASVRTDARTIHRIRAGGKLFLGVRPEKLAGSGVPMIKAHLYAGEQPIGGGVVVDERGWRRILLDQNHG